MAMDTDTDTDVDLDGEKRQRGGAKRGLARRIRVPKFIAPTAAFIVTASRLPRSKAATISTAVGAIAAASLPIIFLILQ